MSKQLGFFRTKEERWIRSAKRAREGKYPWGILDKIQPLRVAMIMLLEQRGYKVSDSLSNFDLLLLFAQRVVGGSAGAKAAEIRKVVGPGAFDGGKVYGVVTPALLTAIAGLVAAVATFFNGMKDLKRQGKLTPEQAAAVETAEQYVGSIQTGLGTVTAGSAFSNIPFNLAGATPFLLLAGAGLAAYLLTRK